MLKICGDSICSPLEMIFKQALRTGMFPSEWNKGNIVPIHKRSDKQNSKNCPPLSLFPICVIYLKHLFLTKSLTISRLINSSLKTGFEAGGSSINQLLPITHEAFTSFDNRLTSPGSYFQPQIK